MSDEVVHFEAMPACASSRCLRTPLNCSKLITSCLPSQRATPTSTITASLSGTSASHPTDTAAPLDAGCYTYYRSCYCDLSPSPLLCAVPCRDSWLDWMQFEDWANTTCPTPQVSMDAVPACARQCLIDSVFEYGCVTRSPLCFCELKALFGCAKTCSSGDNATIATWYGDVCAVNRSVAENIMTVLNTTEQVVELGSTTITMTWYENLVLAVLATSVLAFALHALLLREPLRKRALMWNKRSSKL